jgi:hypothetical protein
MRLWRRKQDDDDTFRLLSEEEKEFVQHDVHEQSKYEEAPAEATPDAPINTEDVSGLEIGLTDVERAVAQREVDEQLGHDVPTRR